MPRIKGYNDFVILEEYAVIKIQSKKYGDLDCLIDIEDIQKVNKFKWAVRFDKGINNYYVHTGICNDIATTLLHRFIMNCPNGKVIDHINHNTLDNRKSNLRICSHQKNMQNRRLQKNNKSGITGISYIKDANRWRARIKHNNMDIDLGRFSSFEDAKSAREYAEKKYNFNTM